MKRRLGSGWTKESPTAFRPINLWKSNSMSGSPRVLRFCLNISFRLALPSVQGSGSRSYRPFVNRGTSYTRNRFQVGVKLGVANSLTIRPYYLLQSVHLPAGWDTNEVVGISLAFKVPPKTK
jgi:hypothetical protein